MRGPGYEKWSASEYVGEPALDLRVDWMDEDGSIDAARPQRCWSLPRRGDFTEAVFVRARFGTDANEKQATAGLVAVGYVPQEGVQQVPLTERDDLVGALPAAGVRFCAVMARSWAVAGAGEQKWPRDSGG